MASSNVNASRARGSKARAAESYIILDVHAGGDGCAYDPTIWASEFPSCHDAIQSYLSHRGWIMRMVLDEVGTLKQSYAWNLAEMCMILRGAKVVAVVSCELHGTEVWASIENFETKQIVKQMIEIPAGIPAKRSA